jgi:radical SAM superfamily enzyme YgiQ (UPF0313 family)
MTPAMGQPEACVGSRYGRLVVLLVRPSKYDDDGYPIRHLRGTLPSNTLNCLVGLTEEVARSGRLGEVVVQVEARDETVQSVDPRRLVRQFRRPGTKLLVGLVGVQTNQFPRAADLARQFRAEGADVLVGGFHVSGTLALARELPPECRALVETGVTLVAGEVEEAWGTLLGDALADRLQPVYNLLARRPALDAAPVPPLAEAMVRWRLWSGTATLDTSRGCPFDCSFCSIITVQGRTMRHRDPEAILARIRANARRRRRPVRHYFFTDDNFARNPVWERLFDGLIHLREIEGVPIDFMMQVDLPAAKIPRFVEKAARAGCVQVFIGLESLRAENLRAAHKPQNRVEEYRDLIARWHQAGVLCHVGYIIGFPEDTYERVLADVRALREVLQVDQASFFMLTPIPGSRDHAAAVAAGAPLDADYNRYDSFHPVTAHPRMSAEEWQRAYRDAWRTFYSFEYMRQSLLRQNPHTYWALLKNLIWYRAAMAEGAHPMVTGFVRLKDRRARRPGWPREPIGGFVLRRLREHLRLLGAYGQILLEMTELWHLTRIRRREYAALGDLAALARRSTREVKLNWARLHAHMAQRWDTARAALGDDARRARSILAARLAALAEAVGQCRNSVTRAVDSQAVAVRRQLNGGARMWRGLRLLAESVPFLFALATERY